MTEGKSGEPGDKMNSTLNLTNRENGLKKKERRKEQTLREQWIIIKNPTPTWQVE